MSLLPAAALACALVAITTRAVFGTDELLYTWPTDVVERTGPLDWLFQVGLWLVLVSIALLPPWIVLSVASLMARVRNLWWTLLYCGSSVALIALMMQV